MKGIPEFEWDEGKNQLNAQKHGVSFEKAILAFEDPNRIIEEDKLHGGKEKRFFCYAKCGARIITVRFTYRENKIRIIGAAFWRKGKKLYEKG